MPDLETTRRIWRLCQGCAAMVYGAKPPSPAYVDRTARLLFGTAAQESGLQWERQRTPRFEGGVGGFGKWQVEPGSIKASLAYLRERPGVLARATQWLFADPHAPVTWPDLIPMDALLWALRLDDNDKLGVLFARLHYFRIPQPIPETLAAQSVYWKDGFNTAVGHGTPEAYLDNWNRYCRDVVAASMHDGIRA